MLPFMHQQETVHVFICNSVKDHGILPLAISHPLLCVVFYHVSVLVETGRSIPLLVLSLVSYLLISRFFVSRLLLYLFFFPCIGLLGVVSSFAISYIFLCFLSLSLAFFCHISPLDSFLVTFWLWLSRPLPHLFFFL